MRVTYRCYLQDDLDWDNHLIMHLADKESGKEVGVSYKDFGDSAMRRFRDFLIRARMLGSVVPGLFEEDGQYEIRVSGKYRFSDSTCILLDSEDMEYYLEAADVSMAGDEE